jgi:hypothetical protein
MDDDRSAQEAASFRGFVEAGSDIAGGVAGTAVGLLIGGPGGAVAGAAGGPAVTRMLRPIALDFLHRALGNRERARVATAGAFAAERIEQQMKTGYEPRHDDFLVGKPGRRSAAEELAERVLLASQRDHEEDKVRFMGNLLAAIAFDAMVDRGQANLLVRLAEELSCRQYCILALCHRNMYESDSLGLCFTPYRESDFTPQPTVGVLDEILDLERRNCLYTTTSYALVKWSDVVPRRLGTTGWGLLQYRMMNLSRIPEQEIEELASLLR